MLKKKTYTELVDMFVIVITYSMLYHTYPIVYQLIEIPESFNVNYFNNPNISDNAVDFVKNLLVEDPLNRMTSHEALNHDHYRFKLNLNSYLDFLFYYYMIPFLF